eukprot:m.104096 g.104096  ORF g.104096 m.104096 type:complete len:85 (+) comp13253_c1_seq4:485-739(+)
MRMPEFRTVILQLNFCCRFVLVGQQGSLTSNSANLHNEATLHKRSSALPRPDVNFLFSSLPFVSQYACARDGLRIAVHIHCKHP